jgi:pimeloyl-ACP methyl ester carboxylesterase
MLEGADGELYYEICDIVPPWHQPAQTILFLNGLAIDAEIWATWLPALADRYRLVRTDLRGFGRSFVPAAGASWSLEAIARDVRDVMAVAGTNRVHFVGESTGGAVGLYLAARQPEALLTLTTVSAAHRGGSINRARRLRDDVAAIGMDAWSEDLMRLRFPEGALSGPMHRWFHDVQRRSAPHACMDLLDMLVAADLTAELESIQAPTLMIAPDNSPFVSVESQIERLRAISGGELHVVAGARHGVAYSHGPECARVLRDFLRRRGS